VSTAATPVRFARELRDLCGAKYVIEDPAKLEPNHILGVVPAIAVEPASAEEIAAVLRFANENNLSVVPAGGFTQQQAGSVPESIDVLLNTSRLTEIEHYDPGDLTVGVGAGYTIAKLCTMIGASGLLFAADPPAWQRATIGGLLATGINGPRRHGYGGLRDYCIGIRFVTGDGRMGKGGGRVVKNVAGYDMMKLLIGSWGTLAVITGASFKLFPSAQQKRTFAAGFATAAEAIDYRDRVLRSPLSPMCLELVSPEAGSLLPGDKQATAWSVYVRATGSDVVLARYRSELGSAIGREISDGDDETNLWRAIADFPQILSLQHPESLLLSLLLPLAAVKPLLSELQSGAEANGLKLAVVGRVGIGHLLAGLWASGSQANLAAALSGFCGKLPRDASSVVLSCPAELRRYIAAWEQSPTHKASMAAVKRALDAKDILNRGRFPL
jgi:glycolate oxidase FAD binding subunit